MRYWWVYREIRIGSLGSKRRSWLGGISLAQPLSLWVLAGFAALAALAIVLFLIFGEYTRKSRVIGQLVPNAGLVTVIAPSSGVLSRLFPVEGDAVAAGASLTLISTPRATASGTETQDVIRAGIDQRRQSVEKGVQSQHALASAQAVGYSQQLLATRRELAQIEREVATRREQVRLANITLDRYRRLAGQKYLSEVQLHQQEQAALEQLTQQQALERQAISTRRGIAQLEQTLRELPAQLSAQQAVAVRDLALLSQEQAQSTASSEILVKSPVAGLITSRMIEPGQAIEAGQPLMSLLPTGSRLQAQLLVPSRAIGFIETGDSVLLRYQAYPYQKFGHHRGKVARISRSALSTGELGALIGGAQAGEPYYRVVVDIERQSILAYGKKEPLRPGMLLEADILGERRKLYEWVLEPLYSLRGKMSG
ncbi:MAG: HlyD family efflux transporter periplasmic adaptor subunit [Luteimonas sp.]